LSSKSIVTQKKWDIYALGIILSDLICNPGTQMEQIRIDDSIKCDPPKLPKSYKLEGLVEGELMLALVSHKQDERPTIEDVKNIWLPKWQTSL
jgi:hypothetical protein